MDYTAGGELFERISEQERFSEGGVNSSNHTILLCRLSTLSSLTLTVL
jgi:hypothetical protein